MGFAPAIMRTMAPISSDNNTATTGILIDIQILFNHPTIPTPPSLVSCSGSGDDESVVMGYFSQPPQFRNADFHE
jgi:hypothetical protein